MLGVLAQVKADKDLIEGLVQPIETADRLSQEIQTWQKQVDDLEYKLDFRGQGVKSMEDIQLELNAFQNTKYITFFVLILLVINSVVSISDHQSTYSAYISFVGTMFYF